MAITLSLLLTASRGEPASRFIGPGECQRPCPVPHRPGHTPAREAILRMRTTRYSRARSSTSGDPVGVFRQYDQPPSSPKTPPLKRLQGSVNLGHRKVHTFKPLESM